MAVEAQRVNLFPRFITNRECVKLQSNMMNHAEMDFPGVPATIGGARPYGQPLALDPIAMAASKACFNKSDSGVTYNVNPPAALRKRPRDSALCDSDALLISAAAARKRRQTAFGSLFDQELMSQIQNQQTEIDRFLAQQTEKLVMELEERHRAQTRVLVFAVQNAIAKKLKEKDEEVVRMGKLNWVLQERVKSLYVENQIWRDLAQTNEATANNLRTNLEQVLAQVETAAVDDHRPSAAAVEDDAESSCGSCAVGNDRDGEEDTGVVAGVGIVRRRVRGSCRKCGEREASVLVLPCRHLCLCTVCGSALLRACPVCDTVMNASVHVNMS
ncbi:PREDICTED: BOI-related E3 ubiquitin-protein ligase 1-like [Tarenaya hassleriana]|uniref:BOI-related E3 ubiquitin-protein ligase 1-like n=1 Tax=Tarenaya hassleriana TaxID=28532 RepID=UPI00053C8AA0|nr:PREDICTED: BOI-related E3 ubiquitin-protein ligase 1-like [Tarenaya hassleriana]